MIATRTIQTRVAFLLVLLAVCALTLLHAGSAHAGEWLERSCSYNGEYIAPEGWQPKALEGYEAPKQAYCEKVAEGGGLTVYATPLTSDSPFAGQRWTWKPPAGSTTAGGAVATRLRTRNGASSVVSIVAERPVAQACEYPACEEYVGKVAVPAGASEVYVQAYCLPVYEGPTEPWVCHMPNSVSSKWDEEGDSVFSAEAAISSAEFLLATKSTPKASGFTGSLTGESVSGPGTLSFTATAAGPGVYQARVKIDGTQVWSQTPNENEGKCVPVTSSGGVKVFDSYQPCPTEAAVHAEIHTSVLADGSHSIAVEVEDAAGDVSTVYTGTLVIDNHPPSQAAPASSPPDRGACNGSPCAEDAKLTAPGQPTTFTRSQNKSVVKLSGRLLDTAGAPIVGAKVELAQQIAQGTPTIVASTTTNATGAWALHAPAGPSRTLTVAYYSHTLDTTPAATLALHELVKAAVSLTAPRHVKNEHAFSFTGHLAGGYIPPGGESVQMELKWGGRWRTIEVLRTSSRGTWTYRYEFTAPPGVYRFRALALANGSYPFVSTESREVAIKVR